MKKCCTCKIRQDENNFYKDKSRNDELTPLCKGCAKNSVHASYRKHVDKRTAQKKEYVLKNSERRKKSLDKYGMKWYWANWGKARAQRLARKAVRDGIITKTNVCNGCSANDTHLHHPDYSKPLKIIELCRSCHKTAHNLVRYFGQPMPLYARVV